MRFEDIDKKIKAAADQHHPPYNEKAWDRMLKLLNEHLPEAKEGNRKIIFFFLLFLLLGGGTFLVISKPWNKKSATTYQPTVEPVSEQVRLQQDKQNPEKATTNIDQSQTNQNERIKTEDEDAITRHPDQEIFIDPVQEKTGDPGKKVNSSLLTNQQKNKEQTVILTQRPATGKVKPVPEGESDKKKIAGDDKVDKIIDKIQDVKNKDVTNITADKKDEQNSIKEELVKPEEIKKNKDNTEVITETAKGETKNKTQIKPPVKSKNGFGFSVSLGPDISKAGSSELGKATLVYGAGISYTKNRFTIKTGVYGGSKIYKAGPNDYKMTSYLPPSTKFEYANANCYVIEIPLNLYYNFGYQKNHNWFAGTGLSSYLMKSEKYDILYNNYGQPYWHAHDVKNKNKHYFSVLNLSAGYTRRLTSTITISAEPYLRLPLKGVGEGKVNLNSAGVLFSIGVNPFNSSQKK